MTERPPADRLPEGREGISRAGDGVSRPAARGSAPGSFGAVEEPTGATPELALAYESGLEMRARSQWAYARIRFFRHRLAVASLIVLIALAFMAIFAPQVAPHGFNDQDLTNIAQGPTLKGWHLFGTDLLGRDYLSRVIYGLRTSFWVALFVASLATAIGTVIGAVAGYYGGWVDNLLMRFTDLILTLPGLAVLLVASVYLGQGNPFRVGLILALLFWTSLARIVRGVFLSLREKEFVEAARAAGAGDLRIIVRHMLPNTVGPIVVTLTLLVATAILTEAALSFLGFGIQPPTPALGKLIADGQTEGLQSWWLVTFPGLVIVIICLAINFVGDGLRDALDPTQRRARA